MLLMQAAGFSGDSSVSGPFVFVSMPMFCGANESLAADVGLTCDMDQHMTWVDVEPTTGGCSIAPVVFKSAAEVFNSAWYGYPPIACCCNLWVTEARGYPVQSCMAPLGALQGWQSMWR